MNSRPVIMAIDRRKLRALPAFLVRRTALYSIALTLLMPSHVLAVGTWLPLTDPAPASIDLLILLSDGTVMAHAFFATNWYRLTPDSHGSYPNGAWTTIASMHDTRLYYSSDVLRDGRVFVAGGEYGTGMATAEVYDPRSDTWTQAPVPTSLLDPTQPSPEPQHRTQGFYDAPSEVLPNGKVLVAPKCFQTAGETMIYDPVANIWSAGPNLFRGVYQDEASWVKLPDDSILTVDPFGQNSERYIPSANAWINDGNVPVALYDYGELGAAFLLPNGKAIFLGGTGHTAIYTPSGNTSPGTWVAGPDFPNGQGTPDAPAAMMVNGKILCAVSPTPTSGGNYPTPTSFYEYDYSVGTVGSFTQVGSPTGGLTEDSQSEEATMLDLPDGTVLYYDLINGSQLYIYQPDGSPLPSGKPTISSLGTNVDGSYHLTGTQLNGISEGAAYGDDAQMDSDYPLVRLTDGSGNVFYARTYNWSSTSVMASNTTSSTEFTLPPGLPLGTYSLVVVANGIASDAVPFSNLPTLSMAFSSGKAVLSWSTNYPGGVLETTPTLNPAVWTPVPGTPAIAGSQYVFSVGVTYSSQFFRLAPIISGTALSFDGLSSYVSVGGLPLSPPWTAEFWVNRQDASNYSASLMGNGSTALKLEQFNFTRNVGFTRFGVADYTFNYSAPTNTWVHLAFVCDTTTRLYVNGVLQDSNPNVINLPLGNLGYDSSGHPDYLHGTLDEVRVWNVARTQAQIQANMNHTLSVPQANLVGYWKFDEDSGTYVVDSSGSGKTGMLQNSPVWVISTAPLVP